MILLSRFFAHADADIALRHIIAADAIIHFHCFIAAFLSYAIY